MVVLTFYGGGVSYSPMSNLTVGTVVVVTPSNICRIKSDIKKRGGDGSVPATVGLLHLLGAGQRSGVEGVVVDVFQDVFQSDVMVKFTNSNRPLRVRQEWITPLG